jgi:hypothetical protein
MGRQVIHAYLRGYEKGAAYGPQLSELVHECNGSIYEDSKKIITSLINIFSDSGSNQKSPLEKEEAKDIKIGKRQGAKRNKPG